MSTLRLFVYGTLQPGGPNEHILAPLNGHWMPAYVRGVLHEQGWGAAQGYPGLVLTTSGTPIHGQVITSAQLKSCWESLDHFEGDEYERQVTHAFLRDGSTVTAFVYALRAAA
ncbi:MAG: gamma-glutamylcyclotransferase family protein [Pseudomonadota bacterium]